MVGCPTGDRTYGDKPFLFPVSFGDEITLLQ